MSVSRLPCCTWWHSCPRISISSYWMVDWHRKRSRDAWCLQIHHSFSSHPPIRVTPTKFCGITYVPPHLSYLPRVLAKLMCLFREFWTSRPFQSIISSMTLLPVFPSCPSSLCYFLKEYERDESTYRHSGVMPSRNSGSCVQKLRFGQIFLLRNRRLRIPHSFIREQWGMSVLYILLFMYLQALQLLPNEVL
jgi:hypothetical protein